MNNEINLSTKSKSQSLVSLHEQNIEDETMFTSTKIQFANIKVPRDKKRRKAMLPSQHAPKSEDNLLNRDTKETKQDTDEDIESIENKKRSCDTNIPREVNDDSIKTIVSKSQFVVDNDDRILLKRLNVRDDKHMDDFNSAVQSDQINKYQSYKETNTSNSINRNVDLENELELSSQSEKDENDKNFEEFIIDNFIPFTGKQNVLRWLEETETKFNNLRMVRNLRYLAVPLLVGGEVRHKYIRHRKEIRSFDDFYEFLLLQYDVETSLSKPMTSCHLGDYVSREMKTPNQCKLVDESSNLMTNSEDLSNAFRQPILNSDKSIMNREATNYVGEKSVAKSVTVSNSFTHSESDQTLSDLRKAIVDDLIKNPKTFKGNQDDVNKWIDDIEHHLEIAHIQDNIRLDLISYSLRGDALEWFKNNRSLFTSWETFVLELKKAFTSSFYSEMAFKKLESYSQGENQPIRSYFNEVLKLCKETDPTMSETTKLKTLLNKAKPSIQFEVRKKKPTSTREFLEFAKEAEEIIQLSNMDASKSSTDHYDAKFTQNSLPRGTDSLSSTGQPFEKSFTYNTYPYTRRYNNDYYYRNNHDRNNKRGIPNFNSRASYNNYKSTANFSRNNQQNARVNHIYRDNRPFRSYQTHSTDDNTCTRNNVVNAINAPISSVNLDQLQETCPSNVCSQRQQFGHEASACPNF